MSIKIKKDGQVREFILPATNIQVLDIADKFKKKDLENVIKEISDTEHIYVGEVDETKDGIWIDDGDTLDNAENNGVVERIKEYVDGQIKDYSNPNLLINGDFQVWNNGESFVVSNKYIDIADKWVVNDGTINKTTLNGKSAIKITKSANDKEINLQQYVENIHSLKGNTLTVSWKSHTDTDTDITLLMFSYKSDNSVETFYTGVEKYTSGLIEKHKVTFKIPDTIDDTCETLCIRILRRSSATSEHNIIVSNVKLEIGEQVTPFVPKKYSEELLACNDGVIGSNPNLLINGDFQVNQRGEQTYTNSGGHKYTVDRWNCWSANGKTGTIQKQDDGILCTLDDSCRIRQAIELPPQMQNQYVTLSFEGSVTQGECWVSIMASDSISDYSQSISFGSVNCNDNKKLTVKVIQLKKYLVVDFFTKVRGIIKLKWVKLEFGTVATPFVPKLYSQELADCRRYYEKVVGSHGFATCYGNGTNTVRCITRYSPKRISPTVTISALSTFLVEIGNSDIVPTGYASQYFDPYGNGYFIFNVSNVTNGLAGRVKRSDKGTAYIEFDAEIY